MTRGQQSLLMGLVAVLVLRLSLSDDFLAYVKLSMRPWLIVAGVVLGLVAVALAVTRGRDSGAADHQGTEHEDHGAGAAMAALEGHTDHGPPRLAWLLVIPVAAAFVVAPGSLGTFAASRGASWAPQAPEQTGWAPPLLAAIDGAHELGLYDFNTRAFFDETRTMEGRPLRLVGFVRDVDVPGEFLLTRFFVTCCAADGLPISVRIVGHQGPAPPDGGWVEVEGTWVPNPVDLDWRADGDADWAVLSADTVVEIPEPREPYES